MKTIKNQKELRQFLKTEEAFTTTFNYKGFEIWWNDRDVCGVQHHQDGYFRCDPTTQKEYNDFYRLNENRFCKYEFYLS